MRSKDKEFDRGRKIEREGGRYIMIEREREKKRKREIDQFLTTPV